MGRFIVKGSVTSTLTLRDVVQVLNKFYVYMQNMLHANIVQALKRTLKMIIIVGNT